MRAEISRVKQGDLGGDKCILSIQVQEKTMQGQHMVN